MTDWFTRKEPPAPPNIEMLTAEQAVKMGRIWDYVFPIAKRDIPTDAEYTQDDWILRKDDNACS